MNLPPETPIQKDVEDALQENKAGIGTRIRRNFLTGIVVMGPILITIWATMSFLNYLDREIAGLLPAGTNDSHILPNNIPGIGLLVTITFFTLSGWFARNFLGRLLIRTSEYIVGRMPVVNTIYKTLKQVFETTMGAQSQAFREVVLFEYPRARCWTVGFVTGTTKGEIQTLTDDEVVNVYIPTTPNPTSGFLLFIPRKDLIYVKMTPEDAIKLIVSGGIITPED